MLASLLLNRVTLLPGQGLYLSAGNLHAYLSGFAVELMANSDNVLRGGLTPKHVDVPELMRVLLDDEGMSWDDAWRVTTSVISYTNHTIMSEALEKWSIDMYAQVLPRIWTITNEINERFCKEMFVRLHGDTEQIANMAIVANGQVRITWNSVAGKTYTVYGSSQVDGPYTPVGTVPSAGNGETFADFPGLVARQFYRVSTP